MCGLWNREGYLCSRCKKGYGLAISNVFMSCVQCRFNHGEGWIFYIMLQLSPVIILFTTLLVFRVSVAKPPLNAYVTFCHLSLAALFVHFHQFLSPLNFVNDSPALIGPGPLRVYGCYWSLGDVFYWANSWSRNN